MKKITLCLLAFLMGACTTVVAGSIQAEIVQRNITYKARRISHSYPFLSYDNITYMAVRDVGKLFSKNIRWDEDTNLIHIDPIKEQNIKNKETGEMIGKAIIKELYGDRLTENTVYHTVDLGTPRMFDDAVAVYVIFDCDNIQEISGYDEEEHMVYEYKFVW